MKQLILLVGPPGSGKTTLAHQIQGIDNENQYFRISQDEQGKRHLYNFQEAIKDESNIIIDRMGFNVQQRDRYLKPAKEAGYKTKIIVLHESYNTCLERCLERKNHPTIKEEKDARSALNTFFSKYERVQDSEADIVERVWPKVKTDMAVICDLDGTLCNVDHRLHHFKDGKKNWKGFFEGIKDDEVNPWCRDILNGLHKQDYIIVYASGRPDDYRKVTEEWLKLNNLEGSFLFMRNRHDSRKDSITKEIILDFEILTRFKPLFIIDDRQQVVDMWRKRGYTCLQCAPGDF